MKYQIITGDNRQALKQFPDNYFDSIVTDPPYGIDFLGKAWDANTGALETYQECLRVLKPGGHILAFSAARTYHHLAITLEQAGFEIRDQIMWIYSSGFPKSQDVGKSIQRSLGVKEKKVLPKEQQTSTAGFARNGAQKQSAWSGETTVCTDPEAKQWEGWGTALKPAHEPIALARKPLKQSVAQNCQQWGTGALNIDASRVGDDIITTVIKKNEQNTLWYGQRGNNETLPKEVGRQDNVGRFPSNVLGEIPDYQKYFYCPKVSRRERHMGFDLDQVPTDPGGMYDATYDPASPKKGLNYSSKKDLVANTGNNHPTVKPVELMKYLIKLITPPGGRVLDPFNGSGSTGMAAVELGHEYVGIELDEKYARIATQRIEGWTSTGNTFNQLFD